MTLYEIDSAIMNLADPETGEITDLDALDQLEMERDRKIENVALWYKNLTAEAKAIDDEMKGLKARRDAKTNKAERLKKYLDYSVGEGFETASVKISRRKNPVVKLDDQFMDWAVQNAPEFIRVHEPEPDKIAIKAALKDGEVPHAEMGYTYSMTIK